MKLISPMPVRNTYTPESDPKAGQSKSTHVFIQMEATRLLKDLQLTLQGSELILQYLYTLTKLIKRKNKTSYIIV